VKKESVKWLKAPSEERSDARLTDLKNRLEHFEVLEHFIGNGKAKSFINESSSVVN
jgi:hypothetical protein